MAASGKQQDIGGTIAIVDGKLLRNAARSHHKFVAGPAVAVGVCKFKDDFAASASSDEVGHVVGIFSHHETVGGAGRNHSAALGPVLEDVARGRRGGQCTSLASIESAAARDGAACGRVGRGGDVVCMDSAVHVKRVGERWEERAAACINLNTSVRVAHRERAFLVPRT